MRLRLLLVAAISTAVVLAGAASGHRAGRPVVGRAVARAVQRRGSARVVIAFRYPRELRTLAGTSAVAGVLRQRVLTRAGSGFRPTAAWDAALAVPGVITAAGIRRLRGDPDVRRIDLDAGGRGADIEASALIHAPQAQTAGFRGTGVTVAVLDSGLQEDHPDLADSLVAEHCFTPPSGCPNGTGEQAGTGSARDDNGHGTNVAGIITGNGTIAPVGIAPDARLVAVRVLDAGNRFSSTAQVVSALQWILDNPQLGVKVVNMSFGTDALFTGTCDQAASYTMALASIVHSLRLAGVTLFASSGNQLSAETAAAPACLSEVVAVGAVYDSNFGLNQTFCLQATAADKVTCFSNSSTALDLLAPGAAMTSTGRGSTISTYFGTSQASPAAAAAAADMLQANPALTPDQLEAMLKATGTPVTDARQGRTTPRIDVLAAVNAARGLTTPPTTTTTTTTTTTPTPTTVPVTCRVPGVVGMTFAAARSAVVKAHCAVGTVSSRYSAKQKGRIVGQSPARGAHRARGARVSLVLSRGPKR